MQKLKYIPPHTHTKPHQSNKPIFEQRANWFAVQLILLILNPVPTIPH